MEKLRLVLADARPVRRRRLGKLFAAQPGIDLVACCATIAEAYMLVESQVPMLVLSCEAMRSHPGYAMFAAMMRLLGVRGLSLEDLAIEGRSESQVVDALARLRRNPAGLRQSDREDAARLFGTGSGPAVGFSGGATLATSVLAPPTRRELEEPGPGPATRHGGAVVVVGASTGGVEALHMLLVKFPADCPPILVVQHIRGDFTATFAARLNRLCAPEVGIAGHDMPLQRGQVLIAPGSEKHLEIACGPNGAMPWRCRLVEGDKVSGHRPSVDSLFRSAVGLGPKAIGVLLTGMGQDGARGLLALRQSGAMTIAQDRDSSTVYGMPRVAAEIGAVAQILPLDRIAEAVLDAARATDHRSPSLAAYRPGAGSRQ